ncbi:MAG: hypothetical protein P1S60_05705, partial [Anaerolineae bacterium]|nr:hypothetical protein [Anaerolineae bacterium]
MNDFSPLLGITFQLVIVLWLLMWADRWLHRNLQGLMYLITEDKDISLWLYAITLLPGVTLHELSHAFMAGILGVKIGKVNILPRRVNKRVQLGYVPIANTDFIRASLVGFAPLLLGGTVSVIIGHTVFGTPEVVAALSIGSWLAALQALREVLREPDFWLWAYLVFTIGNTMLPSRSDIHAVPYLILLLVLLAAGIVYLGGQVYVLEGVGRVLALAQKWLILLCVSTLLVDLPFFMIIYLAQRLIER